MRMTFIAGCWWLFFSKPLAKLRMGEKVKLKKKMRERRRNPHYLTRYPEGLLETPRAWEPLRGITNRTVEKGESPVASL